MKVDITLKEKCLTISLMTLVAVSLILLITSHFILQTVIIAIYIYLLINDRPTLVYAICSKVPRDAVAAYRFAKINLQLKWHERNTMTVAKQFEKTAKKYPKKCAFIMNDIKLTFEEVEEFTNKIASYFKLRNFTKGDTVALLMEANPYYSCIWLGLSKIGIITALINTNLKKESLIHCIRIANSKAIIVGAEMGKVLEEIRHESGVRELPLYQFNQNINSNTKLMSEAIDLNMELKNSHSIGIKEDLKSCKPKDKLLYIYTSGTTGLPKAAVITNIRYMIYTIGCYIMIGLNIDDIIYTALPLYHTAGGIVGSGQVFMHGLTQAIRSKFSASNFWTDCIKYNCTAAQYIGEICRYVLSVPEKSEDRAHNVKIMYGNGLRPQIWSKFQKRFKIKKFVEIYGSTEGISNTINIDNTMGAVGFMPRFPQTAYPNTLVRCNEETGEVIRVDGRCVKCKPGEPGVFIGRIDPKSPILTYSGYVDEKASKKKILQNVFKDGDNYFDSGDILVMDVYGYIYFKDRLGDTFRWRGENVSTTEVEAIISNIVQLQDCIVYGVEIPNSEGKAGMVAIVDVDNKIDFNFLAKGIRENLAPYARPVFLRILQNVHMTGTFKLVKKDLQNEGFNITLGIKDPLYWLQSDGTYKRLTDKDYDDIVNGETRL